MDRGNLLYGRGKSLHKRMKNCCMNDLLYELKAFHRVATPNPLWVRNTGRSVDILWFRWALSNRVPSRSGPGPWFNIKMLSYQYRKSHCGDKTILRPFYLHNGISNTGKTTSLYWIRAQFVVFLGRIRFTPQDQKVLPMDDIQLFRKTKLRLNHY